MEFSAKVLLEYACSKFEKGQYGEALEAFVLAYEKGIERNWVLENIYSCYMSGNDSEFRKAYQNQVHKLECGYDACVLDFIPYQEGEYFIFDKEEKAFLGKFSMWELYEAKRDPAFDKIEFSAAAVQLDWDWRKFAGVLAEARNREIYAVCCEIRRAESFYKIPELSEYMERVRVFSDREGFREYFHKNTSVYMPLIVAGNEKDAFELKRILEEEHLYRLTPEGRNTQNVLLTIGIPTHDRGNLLLKRLENLRKMPYDAEIEIAISKNGEELYQKEYKKVSQIADARINYYDHGCSIGAARNWIHVVNMAKGKYVLMVSDEDDVVLGALEHYLKLLVDYPDISLARAKTVFQVNDITERFYGKKGAEAFGREVFRQNYLSSLIFRKEDFVRENFIQLERLAENAFYKNYPHEWWCARLSQTGDYLEEPVILISEGESVLEEEVEQARKRGTLKKEDGIDEASGLPLYATYESRLKQFSGMMEFIRWIAGENQQLAEIALKESILKVMYLLKLARSFYEYDEKFECVIKECVCVAIRSLDEILLDEAQKRNILEGLNRVCINVLEMHEERNRKALAKAGLNR